MISKLQCQSRIKLLLTTLFVFFVYISYSQSRNYEFVNPFIGTGGHGHTFPGAVIPFGMVQLSPDTRVDGSWDGCSGYHYSDTTIYGFSHTHLSGTGCTDWGDVLLMPLSGKPSMENKVYASGFNHKNEIASAGYYSVVLNKGLIKVDLTATARVGIHRYTFPKIERANIILDLLHRDRTIDCGYKVLDSTTLVGYRISEAWAKEQHMYFAIRFSKPFQRITAASDKKFVPKLSEDAVRKEGANISFDGNNGQPIMVKVAISSVSEEGALKNMEEAKHWNFEDYKLAAEKNWEDQLNKVTIAEKDKDKKSVFYTAMYHCFIHPSLNMDIDGYYRARDNKIYKANGFVNYSVFSLWDTYRALHPLFTILEKKRTNDFINSFLRQYNTSGRLPMWELSSNETDCMIGFHAVSVVADAYVKGIRDFDPNALYNAMKASSVYTAFGIPTFNKNGFLQVEDESESVSKSLEYAYDNWCIAQMAKSLGKQEDEKFYLNRSLAYKHLFDAETGHMRPRKNGNWLSPFYANEINNHFTEGNSWHYSFYVPHDVNGLIELHGGDQGFEKKLDELFSTSSKTRGREQADVTGLIGQYAHGNEPSHHMAYLYNFVGKPQKAVKLIRKIGDEFYKNSPDGLIGNEDCGQMSAWYVLSAMGFYPVCPGSTQYVLGEPFFNTIQLKTNEKEFFTIKAEPEAKKYVTAVVLNGKTNAQSYFNHSDILPAGSLEFLYAAAKDAPVFGEAAANRPVSRVDSAQVLPAPIIAATGQVFKENLRIELKTFKDPDYQLLYSTDGGPVKSSSNVYTAPFEITENTIVKTRLSKNVKLVGLETEAKFYKLKYDYDIQIKSKANAQYMAEGGQTLVDGIRGSVNWRKGDWLGYQGQDLEFVVDMKSTKSIGHLALGCLQDSRSWIMYPTEVSYYGSLDNKNFTLLKTINLAVDSKDYVVQNKLFSADFSQTIEARYIKVIAKNFGKLPEDHQGAGGESFIFVDELEMK